MTSHVRPMGVWILAVVALAATAACGGGTGASLTPTSPTSASSSPPIDSGAVITGRVSSTASAPVGVAATDRWSTMATTGITVTVVGTSVTTSADAAGQFTLTGVPPGNVQLKFSGPGVDATLTISGVTATDRIEINVTLSGNNARLDSDQRSTSNNGVDVQGLITGVNPAARTLEVAGQTVNVPATAVIRHGSTSMTLADLRVNDRVQVKGTRVGGVVVAAEVKVETQSDNGSSASTVEVEGIISGLGGTCPSVSFIVGMARVFASPATSFKDGACTVLKNGSSVEVQGRRSADGSIAATEIENKITRDDDDDDDDGDTGNSAKQTEISGTVAGLGGACPSITFTLGSTAVKTDAKTDFKDACSKVKNAAKVEVKGTRGADGKILATRIQLDD